MCQFSLKLEEPLINEIAARFNEKQIFYIVGRGWIAEYVADHAIKLKRVTQNENAAS